MKRFFVFDRKHCVELIKLALPVSLGQLGHIMTNIADSVMLGRYDVDHLAGSTFAFNAFIPFMIFCIGFSIGITPVIAEKSGTNDKAGIGIVAKNSLILYPLVGCLITLVLLFVSYHLDWFGQTPTVTTTAEPYYRLLAYSVVPIMVFQVFKQYGEGISITLHAMYISIAGNLINIILNYILIYGKFGFEPMGIEGAGIATLIARILMGISGLCYIFFHSRYSLYIDLSKGMKWCKTHILVSLAKVSFPISIQMVFEVTAFAIAAIMIGWIGKLHLAAHNIAIGLASISFITASGVGAAVTIRVGYFYGKKDFVEVRKVIRAGLLLVLSFMGVSALIFWAGHQTLPLLFVKKEEVEIIQIAGSLLCMAALFQLSDGLQLLSLSALRGIQDVKIPTFITLLAYWIVALPSGYTLAFVFDLKSPGIWIGLVLGLTVSGILLFYRLFNRVRGK